jgi:deazaflavin-dependent oxidoreductase (nitroreductase family)
MALDPDGVVGRTVQAMARNPAFARIGPRVVPPIDRFLARATGGRVLLGRAMLPCAVLTTTGRRSGEPRRAPVAAVPIDGDLHVVGSNFGRDAHPAWSWNLLADPHAEVTFEGRTFPVTAVLLDEDERRRIWPELLRRWPPFDTYAERSGRELRVFRLVTDEGAAAGS